MQRQSRSLMGGLAIVGVLFSPALRAQETSSLPQPLQDKIAVAKEACAEFDGGEFALEWGAIERVDLDGDLVADWVLNESGFACSSAASLYGGTGGSMSHFVVDGQVSSLLNQGWEVVSHGRYRVVLANVHGSQCDGINPTPCVTSSIWDGEAKEWRSASADWE
ncbi:hypothetical protein [Qipengyuania aquimaris]|uniref:hypothetical protein n=1 Tax=Qipengyuania aquimaris TaxID=255984 RepID=UPI001FCF8593|nr:hypothetical protein [Qipengyuania aquimaris]UOR14420.1 hypothetical protein LCM05_07885 [Qipengyuania aquimaris]